MIQGLAQGDYKIKIERDGYNNYESSEAILVVVGTISEVETIELTIPTP